MTTSPQRTERKPAEDRRREIADAALRVIAAQGLGRFTSLAIAREVGLTDAALFRHFPSKDAIVDAAIDRVEEILFEGFPPQGDDPVARLGAFFRRRVEAVRVSPGVSRLVATDELAKAGSGGAAGRVAEFRRRSSGFVRDCISDAAKQRLLAPGLEAEAASFIVLGALVSLAHTASAPAPEVVARVAPRMWETLESFLRGPRARPQSAGTRPPRRTGRRKTRSTK